MPIIAAVGAILAWIARIGPLLARMWAWFKSTKWGAWLVFTLFTYMGGIIGRIFTFMGITLAVNEFATPTLTQFVAGQLLSMPTVWVQLIALTKVDQALTIMLSAITIAVANKVSIRRRRDSWQTPL